MVVLLYTNRVILYVGSGMNNRNQLKVINDWDNPMLVPYYKALKNSQFKDLTCLYDKLKSTVTNEEWQEILNEVGDEPDKEDE